MNTSNIFELVRKEQIIVWAGSGLSNYAGYPLGKDLARIIYNSLSTHEQHDIEKTLSLADLTEQFIRMRGGKREQLNAILKQVFHKHPSSVKYHQILSNIPHIKTIITTNYDNLFEQVYGKNCLTIVSQKDVGLINGKTEIFKIHGDIDIPSSIVISKSDYANFFAANKLTSLYWSVLAERISNNSVLFIGYDLEDDNVLIHLENVWSSLEENRKEAFLIAPGLKKHKIDFLNQKGIQYIDYKAEPFIEKLYQNIKDNIVSDFEKKFISAETLNKFMKKNDLSVDLKSFEDKLSISKINPLNNSVKGNFSVALNDSFLNQKIQRFINGEEFGEIEFNITNVTDFKFSYSGVNLLDDDITKYKFILQSSPAEEGIIDIAFDDGFELNDINYKIFASKKQIKVESIYKGSILTMALPKEDTLTAKPTVDFTVISNEKYEHVSDAVNTCKFLDKFTYNKKFKIFPRQNNASFSFAGPLNIEYNRTIKDYLDFYELLKKVEQSYNIKFKNITAPTNEIHQLCQLVLNTLNEKENFVVWDNTLEFPISADTPLELLLVINKEETVLRAYNPEPEIIQIYNQEINIGYKNIIYFDLYISNLVEVMNDKTKIVKATSKSKGVKIVYQKNPIAAVPSL